MASGPGAAAAECGDAVVRRRRPRCRVDRSVVTHRDDELAGAELPREPHAGRPGAGRRYVHDPDGHSLEFLTTTYSDEFLTSC